MTMAAKDKKTQDLQSEASESRWARIKNKFHDYFVSPPPLIPILRFDGVIGATGRHRQGINFADLQPVMAKAFKMRKAEAIAVVINSPGGAPVQTALIANYLRAQAEEHDKKIYVFIEDIAASGGYWLACAGDAIYADAASLIGSIGVISAGFGLDRFIAKHGVERRIYTAGETKSWLDPFQAEKAEDVARLKTLQEDIHGLFQDYVLKRRRKKLKAPGSQLFTGDVWTGLRAKKLGLIDDFGHYPEILRKIYGQKLRMPVLAPSKGLLKWKLGLGPTSQDSALYGQDFMRGAVEALEEYAARKSYGL